MEWVPPAPGPVEPPGSRDSGLTGGRTQLPHRRSPESFGSRLLSGGNRVSQMRSGGCQHQEPPTQGHTCSPPFKVLLESPGPCSYSGGQGHKLGEGQDPRKRRGGGSGRNHWTTSLARTTGQSQVPLKLC